MRRTHRVAAAVAASLSIAAGAVAIAPSVLAQPSGHEITLCHATSSSGNPYIPVTVDVSSASFEGHAGHDGPIWSEGIEGGWGDIIPPFDFGEGLSYPGKNWPVGADWASNGCTAPPPTTSNPPPPPPPPPADGEVAANVAAAEPTAGGVSTPRFTG